MQTAALNTLDNVRVLQRCLLVRRAGSFLCRNEQIPNCYCYSVHGVYHNKHTLGPAHRCWSAAQTLNIPQSLCCCFYTDTIRRVIEGTADWRD
ncbi:hypothetical protein COCSUDRAFT_32069 [Coccomyxa subellipsoidea C-169]|uniref:Uncharacterized protein n=1 Tax=Coccomyxa subellipsoidea (strain C-169) TaxID=574566 RepID=I0ZAI3_COCSC|nr:hypothetical protein COCSUDRAFT_32069 [Coccomyxa subellipsoidea C-169]EIE27652.1 hypothetical protein COCSUDRAFT_32069 [Coccomyxa subellipsoidea C-169]|eukprot:XP_005652196.1 hypothetical protein COCSUDRAFT_32069 [Coccomyxa subellipsoidea C-169]